MRKVSDILMDLVPLSNDSSSPNSLSAHCDAVKRAIMKHFSRHDAFQKGVVAEEHFTLFLTKSGLKNRLRSSEVRKLCSKLRKRNTDNKKFSCKRVSFRLSYIYELRRSHCRYYEFVPSAESREQTFPPAVVYSRSTCDPAPERRDPIWNQKNDRNYLCAHPLVYRCRRS